MLTSAIESEGDSSEDDHADERSRRSAPPILFGSSITVGCEFPVAPRKLSVGDPLLDGSP